MSLGKHQVPQKQTKKRVENYQNRNRIKTEKSKEISKVQKLTGNASISTREAKIVERS